MDKYLNGYEKSTTRQKKSSIDDYYEIIKELLSDENQQIFYYKRVLWQFLKEHHQLDCAQSSFADISASILNFSNTLNADEKTTAIRNPACGLKPLLGNRHS